MGPGVNCCLHPRGNTASVGIVRREGRDCGEAIRGFGGGILAQGEVWSRKGTKQAVEARLEMPDATK